MSFSTKNEAGSQLTQAELHLHSTKPPSTRMKQPKKSSKANNKGRTNALLLLRSSTKTTTS